MPLWNWCLCLLIMLNEKKICMEQTTSNWNWAPFLVAVWPNLMGIVLPSMNVHPNDKCGAVSLGFVPRYPQGIRLVSIWWRKSGWVQLFLYLFLFLSMHSQLFLTRLANFFFILFFSFKLLCLTLSSVTLQTICYKHLVWQLVLCERKSASWCLSCLYLSFFFFFSNENFITDLSGPMTARVFKFCIHQQAVEVCFVKKCKILWFILPSFSVCHSHVEGWAQDYRKSDDCFSPNLISSPWRRYEDYNISFCKQWKFRCHCSYEQWHLNLHCLQRGPSCP